ncbi:MAG: hypothetical protein J6S04_00855, partial [Clostridia bacterium]|nr:hypothetical protein [Clostridia bacterium]
MDYPKSIKSLLKEARAGVSYQQLSKPYRAFLKIALFPIYIVEVALIMAYYIQLFFYNAMMSPVNYLEAWQEKKKEGIQHATQAVLYFVSTPAIFFFRVIISLMSFSFFFQWFLLMCFTYLATLGGVEWQPYINVAPEKEGVKTVLKSSAGEKFATVALVFFALFIILIPFNYDAYEALMVAMAAYGVVVFIANPIVSAAARKPVEVEVAEHTKDDPPPIVGLDAAAPNGMFDNFVFASLMMSFVALFMFILAWDYNGSDLFLRPDYSFGYYYNYNGLPFVAILLLILCAGMGIAKLALSMFMGIGKPIVKNAKTILAVILLSVCTISAGYGTFKYIQYEFGSNNNYVSSSYITDTQAVATARNSSSVQSTITTKYNIYYSAN